MTSGELGKGYLRGIGGALSSGAPSIAWEQEIEREGHTGRCINCEYRGKLHAEKCQLGVSVDGLHPRETFGCVFWEHDE